MFIHYNVSSTYCWYLIFSFFFSLTLSILNIQTTLLPLNPLTPIYFEVFRRLQNRHMGLSRPLPHAGSSRLPSLSTKPNTVSHQRDTWQFFFFLLFGVSHMWGTHRKWVNKNCLAMSIFRR